MNGVVSGNYCDFAGAGTRARLAMEILSFDACRDGIPSQTYARVCLTYQADVGVPRLVGIGNSYSAFPVRGEQHYGSRHRGQGCAGNGCLASALL